MDAPPPEAFSRVRYLYDSLTPKPDELLARGRYYIREGPLLVWDENRRKKSKRYIFLLNDVLLITKRDGRSKYWLRVFITLRSSNVSVENMSSGFDAAFRLSVKTRSFVFFSDGEVDSWIEDLQKCIQGPKGETSAALNGDSRKSTSLSGFSSSSSTKSPARGAQPDFNFFTDGEFQETKVTFDSGVKLGAIRSDRGSGDNAAVPVLAPPPGRTNSVSSMSRSASSLPSSPQPATTAPTHNPVTMTAPATQNGSGHVQSLEEFLGLTPSKPSTTTSTTTSTSSGNLFGAPAQPVKSAYDPFGGLTLNPPTTAAQPNWGGFPPVTQPTQPTQPLQPTYTNGNTSTAQPFNPFAVPASNTFGAPVTTSYTAQPSHGASTFAPQSNYGGSAFTAPAQPQQQADPFAALWSSPAPAQPKAHKSVDFF